jgi:hypothetical protein
MPYALRATIRAALEVRESADDTTSPASAEGGNQRVYDQYGLDVALSGETGSYPEIGGQAIDLSHTLSGGTTKDFDLTAAPWCGDISTTVDKTGKKLVAIELQFDKGNNAAGVAFGPQGGNGYALFGAGLVPKFFPGATVIIALADPDQESLTVNTPTVGGSAKDLRFTGADGDSWVGKAIFTE